MPIVWQQVETHGILKIPCLPIVRIEAPPVFSNSCESRRELYHALEASYELNLNLLYRSPTL